MNVASGCPQFTKLSTLDDDNYVKDDVMYIKCIVDTSRIFHPWLTGEVDTDTNLKTWSCSWNCERIELG